ncbi:hypothetical protein AB8U03_12840 [Clostridium sp. Mt-5]|uniref:Lipoprotein n=1 Tax=Clostridium moutaii TaxID=3240932 RepID=A0ABV4BTM5_9CLOT
MKKIFVIILFMVFIGYILFFLERGYSEDPYTGKYECPQNNLILVLSKNNDCTVINNLYRDTFCIKGRYSIRNNNITIVLNEGKSASYRKLYFKGEVEGHRIEFNNFCKNNIVFYLKNKYVLFK